MSDQAPPPPPEKKPHKPLARKWRVLFYFLTSVLALLLIVIAAAVLVLPSQWFREKVRARIIYEVERATGGRVEVGSFRFEWVTLTAEVAPFVLHGTEPAGEAPLFQAASVKVDLKVVSLFGRDIDIAALDIDQPRLNLLLDENGITNFPRPKIERPSTKHPVERLVDLAIRDIALRHGEVHYGDQRIDLDIKGRYLEASLAYDFNGPSYQGSLKMSELTVDPKQTLPMTMALDSKVALFKNHVQIERAVMSMKETTVEASGSIEDFRAMRANFDLRAAGSVAELGPKLRLPKPHVGNVNFTGKFSYGPQSPIRIVGRATGQHLAVEQGRIRIQDISLTSDVDLTKDKVALRDVTVHALDGVFHGMVDIDDYKRYKVNGKMTGVSIRSLTRMAGLRDANLAGTMNGPVQVTGAFENAVPTLKAGGHFDVAATQDGLPVQGLVEVAFDGRRRTVQLGTSYLTLPSTRLDFNGVLGEQLSVKLESKNVNDLLPALALASDNPPKEMPIQLAAGGSASFEGAVTGPLEHATASGKLTLSSFTVRNQQVDRVVADVSANESGIHVRSFGIGQDTLRLAGGLDIGLDRWRVTDASPLSGSVKLDNARLAKLIADAGQNLPIEGMLHGTAKVSGTVGSPKAEINLLVDKPVIYDEPFDRIRAEVRYAGDGIEVIQGVAEAGPARVLLSGLFTHPENDWKNGRVKFDVSTQGWTLQRIGNLRKVRSDVEGTLQAKATGIVDVRNGEFLPRMLDSDIDLKGLTVEGRSVGDVDIDARTAGKQLDVTATGHLRGSKVNGKGSFELAGDYPGTGELSFSPVAFPVLQDLTSVLFGTKPMPLDGYVGGKISFSGPVRKPEQMKAQLELPTLQVVPARRAMTARQIGDLALRIAEPMVIAYDGKAIQVRSGHLVGRDTDLNVSGMVGVTDKSSWDLHVKGNLNLGVLQDFNQDLVSSGAAIINASVRGALRDPNLTGRMELKNASFYLADLPNGLDNANGMVVFDQRRATIEKLTANTGGGTLSLSGFVGFGGDVIYRLQGRAESVRIRYPEGVSTTANATLSLTGTPAKSMLSGVVTVVRAGFNPRTDLAGLLATNPIPVASATSQNEFLRGMQFDVRVETVPNLQFQTSLTSDLQAEADLRLRGTAAKPVVLGRIVISQGEIQFFGNKYTINRGEIGFFNPVRVEPALDMDLETRVRGVLVNINFNGPLRKLNVSYRSDPPLQSAEIIALLAVGRAPGSNSSLASSQTVTTGGIFAAGTNSLLGQAVAAPISGRLQRFFGVSRLKIDPQLTGLSAVPQARLTIEQQISRDVTLTYVTNLAQANQQIIRLEWDLNRMWSVVAVREENGVFGVDFFFKRRLR